ncbi:MAG: tetratricopeptide repeat protein [Gemmatimonadota bacterium]
MLHLRTLGSPSVSGDSGPCGGAAAQRKSLALLALLAASGSRGLSRDKIVARLWPEAPSGKATHRLTQMLYSLRRELGAEALFLGSTDLRLNPSIISTDIAQLTAALEAGDFARAVSVYGGPFLDGFFLSDAPDFEHWVDEERARLAQRHTAALESLARHAALHGDVVAAAAWWREIAQAEPLNSRVAISYMEALCAAGDRPSALRFMGIYETLLREEFDVDPDAIVLAAAERIRNPPSGSLTNPASVAPAIAVLPFTNLTPNQDDEYFGVGMSDELSGVLARMPGLRVASRTSVSALLAKGLDAREIGERLGVSALVEGTVRKAGNRIRLGVRLVKSADGCQLWSETYERTIDDVFAIQDELSRGIAASLPLTLTLPSPAVRRATSVPAAMTLYLRGRYSAHKRTSAGLALGIAYFEQALEQDPDYALAYAGLAECWTLRGFAEFGDLSPAEAAPRARAWALEAARHDPGLAQAHTWLGVTHFLYDQDWVAAEAEFRKAIHLDPVYAYTETWYAVMLSALGRHDESLRRILHAEAIEPLSLQIRLTVSRCYFFAHRFELARISLEDLLKAEPGDFRTTIWLARTLCALGRRADAVAVLATLAPEERAAPYARAVLAYARAGEGRIDEARTLLDSLEREVAQGRPLLGSVVGAMLYLGERSRALAFIESAAKRRDPYVCFMATDPAYLALRGDARFQRVLEGLRLVRSSAEEDQALDQ